MIDFRLYRVAWLPAIAAFVMVMFSFEGIPTPIEPEIAPTAFDAGRAQVNARQILNAAPERPPGSDGDHAVADLVQERFEEIEAGTAASQSFELSVDGEDAELRNVAIALPGDSSRAILVLASRDSASGPGAASSGAATAALIELAEILGGTDRTKTVVLVSTDAGSEGAEGTREFLDAYPERDLIEAAIVIAQPAAAGPHQPFVLRDSTDDTSTSAQLVRTAEQAVADQAARSSGGRGWFADLARLAMPVAVGDQGVLIAEGVDAVAISSAGEKPLPAAADGPDDLDPTSLGEFGAAVLATVLAIDQSTIPLEHGAEAYVEFAGNLVPGWALATLALALLLPAAIAAVDGVARAARRGEGEARALGWAGALALPPLATLALLYLLSLVGLVASPPFPFDPGRFGVGAGELMVLALLAAACIWGYAATGLLRPPRSSGRGALVPALGTAATLGAIASWLLNPFLALLLAPLAHVWLVATRERPRRLVVVAAVLAALLPAALALRVVTGAVGAGAWDVVLMVADGHISTLALIALCPIFGSLAGLLALILIAPIDRDRAESRPSVQAP
jgi:hypothetical protein